MLISTTVAVICALVTGALVALGVALLDAGDKRTNVGPF